MIQLQIIGNLGKDCLLNTVNGKNVINFNVAHTEKFRDAQGNNREKTQWVDCAYWTDRTGIAPYLKKGTQVWCLGVPDVKIYDKKDGTTGYSLALRVLFVQLLGGSKLEPNAMPPNSTQQPIQNDNYQQNNSSTGYTDASAVTAPIDDLPF